MAQEGGWSSGLFGCCSDFRICCLTIWCPCITFGRVAEIVDQGSSSCDSATVAYMKMKGCACLYSCRYRTKMRKQYGIPGSKTGDCFTHCCCECCALTQMYRELTARGYDVSLGWDGNKGRQNQGVNEAPVAPDGMSR